MDKSCSTVGLEGPFKNETKEETHNEEKSSDAACSSPNSRSSPEANCPICLGKPENKSFTDSCLHQFCFTCLLEWSKVKAECPLCKQSFKSIIHNVRSIEDYEQYYLSTAPAEERMLNLFQIPEYEPNRPREPFRYRTTAVSSYLEYFVRLEEAISNHVIPTMPSRSAPTMMHRRHHGTSDFRRNVYQQGLWVQRTRDVTGRVRDCSPEFYRANPALLHRLAPWLNRELNVLLNANESHVQFVMSRILDLITQTPIRSPRFSAAVSAYIGRHTEHFVHEFYSFASSPYDLSAYDRYANYVGRDALTHEVSDDDGNDSDVQVVALLTPSSPVRSIHLDDSDSEDCVVVDSVPARQITPEVITLESEPDDDVVQVNIHIETDHNRPAPSRRPPLKRKWLKVKNVQMEKSSNDNVNVSINIAHSSRTRSSPSESSSSSWNPSSKSVSTKSKGKSNGKKKTYKCKPSTSKNKTSKSKVKSKVNKGKSLSSVRKKRSHKAIVSSSEGESSSASRLHIVTDHYTSSSSSDESSYKPRLRSVVVKSTVKSEPYSVNFDVDPPSPAISGSYWNECGHSYDCKSETEDSSRSNPVDPYGPSCSHHSSDRRRCTSSSLSPEYKPDLKSKYSKKRSKRQAYW